MRVLNMIAAAGLCLAIGGCSELENINDRVSRYEPPKGADRLMSPADHNVQRGFVATGDPVRRGKQSERYELRHGDCGGSDCSNPRARAEIQLGDRAHSTDFGEDIWYGYSFFNATVPAFTKQNSLRLVFGQWTMGGLNKPIIRFIQLGKGEANFAGCDPKVCNTRDRSRGDLVVQIEDIATSRKWGKRQNNGYICRLFDLTEAKGKWMDIVVNTNFSPEEDGYLRIWVNQKQVCNYTGPLVSPSSLVAGDGPKHRRGVYSSWTKRWQKAEAGREMPRLVVYYDEFKTGVRMGDVDVQQLEAAYIRPVN